MKHRSRPFNTARGGAVAMAEPQGTGGGAQSRTPHRPTELPFSPELRAALKLGENEAAPKTDQKIYDAVSSCLALGRDALPQSAKGTTWQLSSIPAPKGRTIVAAAEAFLRRGPGEAGAPSGVVVAPPQGDAGPGNGVRRRADEPRRGQQRATLSHRRGGRAPGALPLLPGLRYR